MSRYNEDEWSRLKEAEKIRQKRKYQNKYIDDTYKNRTDRDSRSNRGYLENTFRKPLNFNDIKEIKINNESDTKKYIVITFCIIAVIACSFLFLGFYENFFYEKTKKDIISTTNRISSLADPLNKQATLKKTTANKPVKKWKRTVWEVRNGKVCNNNSCIYHVKQYWRDCYRSTGRCNKTESRVLERNNNRLNKTRTTYL